MKPSDEFYIGWQERAPGGIARMVRRSAVCLLGVGAALAAILSLGQRTIGRSVFEWGRVREFSGVIRLQPYPHLLVPRPGSRTASAPPGTLAEPSAHSRYYLVKPFKFGLDPDSAGPFDGKVVTLKGTLIYHGSQTMIEVARDSIRVMDNPPKSLEASRDVQAAALGTQTLLGEIVDSKCYLGVMNPGTWTPHRACAIRCISGGIPPVLLVRQARGPALCFLLVSADGRPVNREVLDFVAEPVSITGEVERLGDLLVLRADPKTYRRAGR